MCIVCLIIKIFGENLGPTKFTKTIIEVITAIILQACIVNLELGSFIVCNFIYFLTLPHARKIAVGHYRKVQGFLRKERRYSKHNSRGIIQCCTDGYSARKTAQQFTYLITLTVAQSALDIENTGCEILPPPQPAGILTIIKTILGPKLIILILRWTIYTGNFTYLFFILMSANGEIRAE